LISIKPLEKWRVTVAVNDVLP